MLPQYLGSDEESRRSTTRTRLMRVWLFVTVVMLHAVCFATETEFVSPASHVFRSTVRGRNVETVCGLTLTVPPESSTPLRAWTGVVRHTFNADDLQDMKRRHQQWLQTSISDPTISNPERKSRLDRFSQFNPQYAAVVVLQFAHAPGKSELRCFVDTNTDGFLQDERPLLCNRLDDDAVIQSPVIRLLLQSKGHFDVVAVTPISREPQTRSKPTASEHVNVPATVSPAYERLLGLDSATTRKQHLGKVVTAADAVIQLLTTEIRKEVALKKLLADCWYRRARAIGYMELPDVVARTPISDQKWINKEFERSFQELSSLVDVHKPEYILLAVRRERRQRNFATAQTLVDLYTEHHRNPVWQFKKRRDLFREAEDRLHAHDAAALFWLNSQAPPTPSCWILRSNSTEELRELAGNDDGNEALQQCDENVWETVLWNADLGELAREHRDDTKSHRYPVSSKTDPRLVDVHVLTLSP